MATEMLGRDAVFAPKAQCFWTIDGKRFNMISFIDFESKWEEGSIEVPVLGSVGKKHKKGTGTGTFSGTAHYNQSEIRSAMLAYKNTGKYPDITIQVTNEDESTTVGKQTIILKQCIINGGVLAKFDANGEYLDESIEGTFDDWDMPEKFTPLEGM